MKQLVLSCGFDCVARQEKSEVSFWKVQDYCDNVKMDLQIKINWAKEANAHYSTLLNDFNKFKESTGKAMMKLIEQQQSKVDGFEDSL